MANKESKKVVKKSNKKKKHNFGLKEFIFDFLSLVFVLAVVLYYGGRCFYFYSLQSTNKKAAAVNLDSAIINNNQLVKTGDGLYKKKNGYYFKGKVENNYVWFANRMFRVLTIEEDNSVRLVSNDLVSMFMWGDSETYDKSNIRLWLTNTKDSDSGIYYNTIPNYGKFVKKTTYTLDTLDGNKVKAGKEKFSDSVVSISLDDYILSGGKEGFLNNGKLYYLLGFTSDKDYLYVEEDGSVMSCDKLDAYGIRSVITIKKNTTIKQGDGTINNPYTIDMGTDNNYVDSYVKLGDDIWKVSSNNNGILKMYLNGYINIGGAEVSKAYSSGSNKFDYYDWSSTGYYLLNAYYPSLPYKNLIVNNKYPLGEFSAETGYYYANIYNDSFEGPITMLNIFDYVSNNELTDFYRNNTTSSVGDIQYVTYSNGLVEEADVRYEKHIVPVISIDSKTIKSGSGRIDEPYVVE